MAYQGDIQLGDTIDFQFTTVSTAGVPTVLAGSPVLSAYVDNGLSQITAGITLGVDHDGVVGLNNVRVVASGGNGFAAATNVGIVITTGTVSGASVVGYVVGSFSIENRSSYKRLGAPAGASVSADIAAIEAQTDDIGAAGAGLTAVPWNAAWDAEVQSEVADALAVYDPPTQAELTTEINDVQTDVAAVKAVVDAVQVKTDFLPSATAGAAGGVFIAGTNAATTVTTALTTTFTGNLTGSVGSVTGAVGSVTGAVGSVTATVSADVVEIAGSATAADRISDSARCIVLGVVDTGSTTTSIVTTSLDPAVGIDDQVKGRIVIFDEATTTARLRGQATDITGSTSGGVLTVTALTTAPVSGDTFVIA